MNPSDKKLPSKYLLPAVMFWTNMRQQAACQSVGGEEVGKAKHYTCQLAPALPRDHCCPTRGGKLKVLLWEKIEYHWHWVRKECIFLLRRELFTLSCATSWSTPVSQQSLLLALQYQLSATHKTHAQTQGKPVPSKIDDFPEILQKGRGHSGPIWAFRLTN